MKIKLIKYMAIFALLAGVFSCREEVEDKFEVPATERVANLIKKCDATLLSSENGWICDYKSGRGDKFRFWLNFQKDKKVDILADFDKEMTTSSYIYNASQGAVLSFSTYGVWHKLADPEYIPVPGEKGGKSFEADYEFVVQKVYQDSIVFKGLKRRNRVVFVKAEADAKSKIEESREKVLEFVNHLKEIKSPVTIVKKGDEQVIELGATISQNTFFSTTWAVDGLGFDITKKEGAEYKKSKVAVKPIIGGFELEPALDVKGVTVKKFVWSKDKKLYVAENDGTITIGGTILPFVPNEDAIKNIVKSGSFSVWSRAFHDDYMKSFKALVPDYGDMQFYYKPDWGTTFKAITIFSKPSGKNTWSNAWIKDIIPTDRPDVVQFIADSDKKYFTGVWGDLFSSNKDELLKFYLYFFGKDQKFLITYPKEGECRFTDVNNPKYWFQVKAFAE